jgi:hypothetical protein
MKYHSCNGREKIMVRDGDNVRERITDVVIKAEAGHLTFEAVMTHAESDLLVEGLSEDIR